MGKIVMYITLLVGVAVLSLNLAQRQQEHTFHPNEKPITEIIVTGDVMLGRTVMTRSLGRNDPSYPFTFVAATLRSADISFINLENPIIGDCPLHYTGFIFCADPRMVEGLTHAGVDIASLANNHTLNYGTDGLLQTQQYLEQAGILYTGVGEVKIIEKNGVRFGFLGFDKSQQGFPQLSPKEKELVVQANATVDVLFVAMHWGVEYQDSALPGQVQLARELVDLGADVIVGHHPHWVQNREHIEGVPVYYSLGNFVFDQMFEDQVREGLAVRLTFEETTLIKEEELPIYMENWAQPQWVTADN